MADSTGGRRPTPHERLHGPQPEPQPSVLRAGLAYTRFIPREELQGVAAANWTPGAFAEPPTILQPAQPGAPHAMVRPRTATDPLPQPPTPAWPAADLLGGHGAPAPAASPKAEAREQVAAARQQGYQDGYRDGLVALDSFKESFASQTSSQVARVVQALDDDLSQLEQQMASSVARVATELARQVVRSELALRPGLVAQVAREAINAVLTSARHITVLVHPDDHALVAQGCEEALAARGARLLAQPTIARGGCRVESDAGVIDAQIATRWALAVQSLGSGIPWDDGAAEAGPTGGDA
jgi:flagellar assembly protein FliH